MVLVIRGVSILVVMEFGLKELVPFPEKLPRQRVSILVVMEFGLKAALFALLSTGLLPCFNPCCNGIRS